MYRLRKRRDFSVVYQQGSRILGCRLILRLRYRACTTTTPCRIGIAVSQKVSKRAVVRNRIKRQLRAAAQQLVTQIQPGWDVVIVVRTPKVPIARISAIGCDYWEYLQELKQLLAEAKILNGH